MSAGKSMAERYDELSGQAATVLATYGTAAPQPTEVHRRCIHLMVEIFQLADKVDRSQVHPLLLTMARTLRAAEDELAADFARVPEEAVRSFLGELRDKLNNVLGEDARRSA